MLQVGVPRKPIILCVGKCVCGEAYSDGAAQRKENNHGTKYTELLKQRHGKYEAFRREYLKRTDRFTDRKSMALKTNTKKRAGFHSISV